MSPDWERCRCDHAFDEHRGFFHKSICTRCECVRFRRRPIGVRLKEWLTK